jgi:hypothetical protein
MNGLRGLNGPDAYFGKFMPPAGQRKRESVARNKQRRLNSSGDEAVQQEGHSNIKALVHQIAGHGGMEGQLHPHMLHTSNCMAQNLRPDCLAVQPGLSSRG